ncbi:MAG: hypothetical protein ACRD35_08845 [Candidatus Acidiferrales bacterium]
MLAAAQPEPIFYLWVIISVAFLVLVWYRQKWRRDRLERMAQEMGFSFDRKGETLSALGCQGLPLLERAAVLSNALRGHYNGVETVLLDCQTGHAKHAIHQTVVCFRLARELPAFELRPESVFDKIGAATLGYQDIDFEASPGFSKSYLLRGAHEEPVRALFNAAVLQFFEQQRAWWVEALGDWLGVYRRGRLVSPGQIKTFLEEARAVSQVFARQSW